MCQAIHSRLDEAFSTHSLVRQLHDVPPHEVFEVAVEGRRVVYKGDVGPSGSAGIEGRVIAFVGERTSVPVPEVLAVGDDYYVAAWHADAPAPDEEHPLSESWASATGRGMATLHQETEPVIDEYGRFESKDEDVTVAGHDRWHDAAIDYARRHRSTLAQYGHADVADEVVEYLEEHPDVFDGAGDPVCCHGWATPEHVSVHDGEVACMVDFEHAIAAPGEFDVWRTCLPVFGRDADAWRAFREGYEAVRPLSEGFDRRKPLYVLLNLVYYVESLYVQDRHDEQETAVRAERLRADLEATLDSIT